MLSSKINILEDMNAQQVRKAINDKTIAIVITGACENHGDHLPFGSDFFVPLELAKRLARKYENTVILPAIPFGLSSHHADYQMTISLEPETLVNLVENIFESIIKYGIRRILIINGHDGNISPIEIASRKIKYSHPEVIIACLESWWTAAGKISSELFEVWEGLGHGGEAETSALLAIRKNLVDLENAPEQTIPKIPSNVRIYWQFNELTATGSTGAPKKATIQKGEKIIQSIDDLLTSFVDEMERSGWKYGLKV